MSSSGLVNVSTEVIVNDSLNEYTVKITIELPEGRILVLSAHPRQFKLLYHHMIITELKGYEPTELGVLDG